MRQLLISLLIILFGYNIVSFAQELSGTIDLDSDENVEASDLRGEIMLEQPNEKKDPYKATQDSTIEYFKKTINDLQEISKSNQPVKLMSEGELTHVAYLYLYCSIKKGVCREVLDAIIEIDIANSAVQGSPECPMMKDFWKVWVANDMERRHSYAVKTGMMRITNMFKQNVLPNYLKCEETVAKVLKDSGKDILVKRYPRDKGPIKNLNKVLKMLQTVKDKIPNLRSAIQ